MKKLFYCSQHPVPQPEIDIPKEIENVREKFMHLPFVWQNDFWFEIRLKECVSDFNSQRSRLEDSYFSDSGKKRIRTATVEWVLKRFHLQVQIDMYESIIMTQAVAPTGIDVEFIKGKISNLTQEKFQSNFFNFSSYSASMPPQNFNNLAIGVNGNVALNQNMAG